MSSFSSSHVALGDSPRGNIPPRTLPRLHSCAFKGAFNRYILQHNKILRSLPTSWELGQCLPLLNTSTEYYLPEVFNTACTPNMHAFVRRRPFWCPRVHHRGPQCQCSPLHEKPKRTDPVRGEGAVATEAQICCPSTVEIHNR